MCSRIGKRSAGNLDTTSPRIQHRDGYVVCMIWLALLACGDKVESTPLEGRACRDGQELLVAAAVEECVPLPEANLFCNSNLEGTSEEILFIGSSGTAELCPVTTDTAEPVPTPTCRVVTATCGTILTSDRLVDDGSGAVPFDSLPSCDSVCP